MNKRPLPKTDSPDAVECRRRKKAEAEPQCNSTFGSACVPKTPLYSGNEVKTFKELTRRGAKNKANLIDEARQKKYSEIIITLADRPSKQSYQNTTHIVLAATEAATVLGAFPRSPLCAGGRFGRCLAALF